MMRRAGPGGRMWLWTATFHGRRSGCARFMVQRELGEQAVPRDLLPYHHDRASALLDAAQTRRHAV